jgi:hypothetical protein
MADDDEGVPGATEKQTPRDEDRLASGDDRATAEDRPTEVAVVRVGGSPAVQWRKRALAVRAAVPQLARNPVVVGASAAVATVALRVAVDVAQRAIGASGSSRPSSVAVTGSILHEVHVVRHVHVVHHVMHHHYPYGALPPWSRWPPP